MWCFSFNLYEIGRKNNKCIRIKATTFTVVKCVVLNITVRKKY